MKYTNIEFKNELIYCINPIGENRTFELSEKNGVMHLNVIDDEVNNRLINKGDFTACETDLTSDAGVNYILRDVIGINDSGRFEKIIPKSDNREETYTSYTIIE